MSLKKKEKLVLITPKEDEEIIPACFLMSQSKFKAALCCGFAFNVVCFLKSPKAILSYWRFKQQPEWRAVQFFIY